MLVWTFALLAGAFLLGVAARTRTMEDLLAARICVPAAWGALVLASVLAAVTGARGIAGHPASLGLDGFSDLGDASMRVDRLSGLFLLICFAVAVPALVAGASTDPLARPRLPAALALALAAVLVILTADHLFVLIFGWEALTFAFYLLSGYDRQRPARFSGALAAAVFGKASGAALLAGGLILAARADTFQLIGLGAGEHGAAGQVAYGLLLLGFGAKVGLVPLQVWLPPAYTAAPGPARAVMAGVAVNVGFYGMWRTLQVLGPAPIWLAVGVLVLGGLTAVLGIAHAAVHPDLGALVAWSSVENAGVITAGFGSALTGSAMHNPGIQAAGLLAATAQVIAHALGKSLLFTAVAGIEADAGTTDLDALRGLTRRLPWAGTGLVIGSLTLAGLPLTAGFASEWFTLESLMQQFRISSLPLQLASAVAGALVALTVGVAGVAFVRVIALTAFGGPPTEVPASRQDSAVGHRVGVAALSLSCLGVAALAPLEVRVIAAGLRPVAGTDTDHALASPWVLQPVFADFSALSPTWLWVVIPLLVLIVAEVAGVVSAGRLWRVRRVPAWSSASPGVDRGVAYTSFAWANPMRRVLANVLLTRSQLSQVQHPETVPVLPLSAEGSSPLTGLPSAAPAALQYQVDVVEVVGRYLYQPLRAVLAVAVQTARRLQSGRLDAYLAYMLIALIAVLAVVTALA